MGLLSRGCPDDEAPATILSDVGYEVRHVTFVDLLVFYLIKQTKGCAYGMASSSSVLC